MNKKITLNSVFEAHKTELEEKIKSFVLPKDSKLIEKEVSDFLNNLFDDKGDFRLGLTQSEDYILQSALSLLEAQRSMASILISEKVENHESARLVTIQKGLKKDQFAQTVGATAIGGVVGKLALGSWGAVIGSIAGTALMLYYATKSQIDDPMLGKETSNLETFHKKFDTKMFLGIIGNICNSVDSIIETFRTQINRVVVKYENQPKPTIEGSYGLLLEGIQSLLGYERTHSIEEEKYVSKLKQKIEDLSELLDNYNLEIVDYTEEHSEWFDRVESANAIEPKMVFPAIVKNNNPIKKGKVFIPSKK